MGGNGLVRVGKRDRRLFMLLLQQKCLTLPLIVQWLAPRDLALPPGKRSNVYFRLNRLIRAGFIKKQKIEGYDVYLLSQAGSEVVRDLNCHKIPLASATDIVTVAHDLVTAEIRHYLEKHGASDWVSDRELRLHADEIPYVPDGACTCAGVTVFVEVELSQKSKVRYDNIARVYTAPKGPDRVLYFYKDEAVISYLTELVGEHGRVGFFKFESDIPAPGASSGMCAGKEVSLGRFLGLL